MILSIAAFLISAAVLWERVAYSSDDYSFDLEWLVIGDTIYRIGYELNNVSAWLLLLIATINLLSLLLLYRWQEQQPNYGYIGLLLFASSGLILSDHMLLFLVCAILSSCTVYLILAHPMNDSKPKAIFRYATAQLLGFSMFAVALVALYWYMPDHSLQFTMLETVFSGPAAGYTPFMKNVIAGALVASSLLIAGMLPYGNWMKHVEVNRPIVRVIAFSFANALLPTFILLRFAIVIGEVNDILWLCKLAGAIIVIWCTFQMLLNAEQTLAYIGMMLLGSIIFAYGHGAYSYVLFELTIICLSLIVIYGAANYSSSIMVYGSFLIAILTLIGVPPLSGYWLHQSLVATISTQDIGWYVVALIVVLCSSLSTTIHFVTRWKNGQKQTANWRVFIVVFPAIILIALGLIWLVKLSELEQWLFNQEITETMQIIPMLLTMLRVGIGVVIAWMFSERLTETFASSLERTDVYMKTRAGRVGFSITKLWDRVVKLVQLTERGLVQLFTTWIPYPIRMISRMGVEGSIWRSVVLVVMFTVAVTALWVGVRGR